MRIGNPKARSITVSVEFEVAGEFLGLYFMNHFKEECTNLGLYGWVKYSNRGTVLGIIQGAKYKVEQMIGWLTDRVSLGSRVDECYLYNYQYLPRLEYRGFNVRL